MKDISMLKRFSASLFCMLVSLYCVFASAAAAPEQAGAGMLTVGVPADRCPVFYRDPETKEITGIGVDLMHYVAAKAGYHITFRTIQEKTLKDALDNTDYDVIMPFGSSVSGTSGRPSIVSENLMQTPFTLVTIGRQEVPPLNKLRVGMLSSLGAVAETVRQLYPGISIALYSTMSECVDALRAGKVDALLHNSYVWSYILQKPSYQDLAVQPMAMFSMDFRVGTVDTPKGRVIIEQLNKGIEGLSDTRRQAVILDHTSRKLYRNDVYDFLYQYGLIILLTVFLFASLLVIAVLKQRALRRDQEEKLRMLVEHDQLTGLLSLNGFRKRAEELLRAHPDSPYYLSYNNIRDFKFINDSLGRKAGDELLKFWAGKLKACMSDEETMGRITADHFVVLRRIEGEEKMRQDEKNVIAPVQNFFTDQGKENRVQLCSGIYVLTAKDFRQIDVDHMLDLARVAEQKARDNRNFSYSFYNPEQWEKGKHIADVVNLLPAAIKGRDLKVWYQPQVDYATGKIIGAEALCRWVHATLGCLLPGEFISTLEESGLIYDLDCFVWERVCQDLHRWNERGIRQSVSVNLSRCDIGGDRNIPEHFQNLIRTYGLTPDQLRIEITETAFAENPELLIRTTENLQKLGFQVEMDDFGSGYSSLHMLKEVPVDRIKLDLHFLTDAGNPDKGRIIVSYMINMVHALGIKLIAEGVETQEQARFLQSRGSNEMQGYYFYKPMTVRDFEKLIENKA